MSALRLESFLPYRLSIASNRVSAAVATAYQSLFGLKIPEWRIIAVVAEGGSLSQQALGLKTQMDKVTVSRAAIGLVDRGLLARIANPADQRSHLLSLTPAGKALYESVAPKALELEAAIFAGFSSDDIATFGDMLDRVALAAAAIGTNDP